MSTAGTYVRARIDSVTKERAADALGAMGLSISDAIRLLLLPKNMAEPVKHLGQF